MSKIAKVDVLLYDLAGEQICKLGTGRNHEVLEEGLENFRRLTGPKGTTFQNRITLDNLHFPRA